MIDSATFSQLTGAQQSTAQATASFNSDFNQFLLLLTTQLQNQDPLEPLDTNDFTQQLVQFSGVEQQIKMNTNLETLLGLQISNANVAALGFIGKEIQAVGRNGYLKDGQMKYRIAASSQPVEMNVLIRNKAGDTVRTIKLASPSASATDYVWDGLNENGVPQPDGIYEIKVQALDGEGQEIDTFTAISGVVTAVKTNDGAIILSINDLLVEEASVIGVSQPSTTTPSQSDTPDPGDQTG